MKSLCVLGATGSVGLNTLQVVQSQPHQFRVVAITAHSNVSGMLDLCRLHKPDFAVMSAGDAALKLEQAVQAEALPTKILSGEQGLIEVASLPQVDAVMAAIVGAAGLLPTLAAAKAGKQVLLANKEALVMAGALFTQAVEEHTATLLPIDSEHNAIFQCLPKGQVRSLTQSGIKRILLTASGGPFRETPLSQLATVTPQQACNHPNWDMGEKISVDSATMMNKGLEVIEACFLFHATLEQVEVVVHPQSVIHSMVEYIDGSVLAQLGSPDMRVPIAHALAWPERIHSGAPFLDLLKVGQLDFMPMDEIRFPCVQLARDAFIAGGTATAILNAANEVAVAAFLEERLPFSCIPAVVEASLSTMEILPANNLELVLAADQEARAVANEHIVNRQ